VFVQKVPFLSNTPQLC